MDNSLLAARRGRLILAPRLGPRLSPTSPETATPAPGRLKYLSWPGWEEYLARRLGFVPDPAGPSPLLLPPGEEPEPDLAALDQLVAQASTLGAELWRLLVPASPGPTALAGAIRRGASPGPQPILGDRAYLALWTIAEYRIAAGETLLAETARRERTMWAALKGETDLSAPNPVEPNPVEPDSRGAYAWRRWRRLAAPLLQPDDIIVPTSPEPAY